MEELERIVGRIRKRWPGVEIWLRGDSGFCRDELLAWCEAQGVEYVLGIAQNPRLKRSLAPELERARQECERTGQAARVFKDFRYRTLDSWSRERRRCPPPLEADVWSKVSSDLPAGTPGKPTADLRDVSCIIAAELPGKARLFEEPHEQGENDE